MQATSVGFSGFLQTNHSLQHSSLTRGGSGTTVPLADRPVEGGFVNLSHTMYGCTLKHLYFVPVAVLFDVFLGTTRVQLQIAFKVQGYACHHSFDQRQRVHSQVPVCRTQKVVLVISLVNTATDKSKFQRVYLPAQWRSYDFARGDGGGGGHKLRHTLLYHATMQRCNSLHTGKKSNIQAKGKGPLPPLPHPLNT